MDDREHATLPRLFDIIGPMLLGAAVILLGVLSVRRAKRAKADAEADVARWTENIAAAVADSVRGAIASAPPRVLIFTDQPASAGASGRPAGSGEIE